MWAAVLSALAATGPSAVDDPACPFHSNVDMTTRAGDLCRGDKGPGLPLCNRTATAQECFELCTETPQCCCFSWMPTQHVCYLKAGPPRTLHSGMPRVSGCQNATECGACAGPPGPPPPPPAPPAPAPGPPIPVIPGAPAGKHYACQPPNDQHEFCDASKSFSERTTLLVSALRPQELVDAVNQGGVPRLGVPPMGQVGAECLHGVRLWPAKCPFADREGMNCTTVFPAASALSRSFNRSQWRQVGAAMADEGRVLFNAGITQSLFFTGPQLNIQRDPRWGRNSTHSVQHTMRLQLFRNFLARNSESPLGIPYYFEVGSIFLYGLTENA